MLFSEIDLYEAVHDVYREVPSPRADKWQRGEDSVALCRRLQQALPIGSPYTMSDMLQAWSVYGKSPSCGNHKKLSLTIEVARRNGRKCWVAGRRLGGCSNEVSLDRLVPGSRGGEYVPENCIIACSHHNSMRGDKCIEDFLSDYWGERLE